jgi:hypothetical protein
MLALLLVAAAGWLTFEGALHYWPAMLGWPLGLTSTIAYVVTIPLYLRSACELCGHSLFKHYGLSMPCTICGCTPGYRDMLRWPLFRQQRPS